MDDNSQVNNNSPVNPWQAQTESMVNLWGEAGRNMWQAWADMAQAAATAGTAQTASAGMAAASGPASAAGSSPAGAPPGTPFPNPGPGPAGRGAAGQTASTDPMLLLAEQWRRLAEQAMGAWTAGSEPVVKDVASGLLATHDLVFRYTRLMTEAWQTLSAQVAAGQDWQAAIDGYREQVKRGWTVDPTAYAAIAGDTAELWRLYLETVGRLVGPWAQSLRQAPGHISSAISGDGSAFAGLSRLYWDAWEHTGGRLLESPSLGMTREFEEELLGGFDAWIDYRRAVAEYQLIVGEAWADASAAVFEALKARAEAGKPISSLRELTTLWTTVTDASMEEAFRSEPYAAAQGRMLNAAMRYRQAERAVVETFLKTTDIASRSELDEAFREIYRLRGELRALRGEMAALKAAKRPSRRRSDRQTPGEQTPGGPA